ncbi:uncharacterized protein LOC126994907 [Eriocheir sinensis]|uniref:uncharacterized protein LOC126994907 n=1 Tax=Eriocheir sinensis TaxID=95602 RepID=UPI0021C68675|nr:uncharacterized protein LOC126994907 [Eriocheir sinensis]
MGLVNQLTEFSPDIAANAQPLRPLMSPRRAFVWTADHEAAFSKVKEALSRPPLLAMFDPHLPTILQTDASRLYGIGYALFKTTAATTVAWSSLHHYEHVTDHRPLIPILNHYTLDAVENPRLQRLKEKLSPYVFTTKWRAGKMLCIPDALSRHPVKHPETGDDMLHNISVRDAVTLRAVRTLTLPEDQNPTGDVRQAARNDETFAMSFYCDGDLLLYGPRVIVPAALRKSVLQRLHDSHRGSEATKRRAGQTVFWPGINADITNVVRACEACQTLLPSQQQEEYKNDDHPTRPFESMSADHFSVAGKAFLVIADRLSGWPVVFPCGRDTTADATIRQFRSYFRDLGVPLRLRTDGGPQFTSSAFKQFLTRWGVRHTVTSPHYPQSNGHAEAAVKSMKHLIMKVAPTGNIDCEDFDRGLLEVRNTPNRSGRSPAQILYGHPLRTCVPAHHASFRAEWQAEAEECDRRAAQQTEQAIQRYNQHARQPPLLLVNQRVRVQDRVWPLGQGRHCDGARTIAAVSSSPPEWTPSSEKPPPPAPRSSP